MFFKYVLNILRNNIVILNKKIFFKNIIQDSYKNYKTDMAGHGLQLKSNMM